MDKLIFCFIFLPNIILITILGFYLPKFSRENIFFGVKIPYGYKNKKEMQMLYKKFKRNYALTLLIPILLLIYVIIFGSIEVLIKFSILFIFIITFEIGINYNFIYKEVLNIKHSSDWVIGKRQIAVVNLKRRDDVKNYPSKYWFIIPILIFILALIMTIQRYHYLPERIPLHYNINNEVDRWGKKTFSIFLSQQFIQVGLFIFMFLIYNLIKKSKMNLNILKPEKSEYQNSQIRTNLAYLLILLTTIQQIIFFIITMNMLLIIDVKSMTTSLIVLTVLVIIIIIFFTIKFYYIYNNNKDVIPEDNQLIIDRDDEKYWIAGMFYYNPDDPSLLVEKRFGIGWDFNYAKPIAKIIAAFLIIIIIGSILLVSFLPMD